MIKDFKELHRLTDSISYIYVELIGLQYRYDWRTLQVSSRFRWCKISRDKKQLTNKNNYVIMKKNK